MVGISTVGFRECKVARAQGVFVGSRADLLRMNAFIGAHHLRPVIDRVFPLEEFDAALKYMAAGSFVGKSCCASAHKTKIQSGGHNTGIEHPPRNRCAGFCRISPTVEHRSYGILAPVNCLQGR
jgi:Zinc-binding dehydrogenase